MTYNFPPDLEQCLSEMQAHGWVFNHSLWRKDGYKSRTTAELYDLWVKYQQIPYGFRYA